MDYVTVVKRIFVVPVAAILFAAAPGIAQQAPGRGVGRGAAQAGGPGGAGPVNAYAYADCNAANAPVVSLVVVTGPVPVTVPASTPQPSVKFVLNTNVDGLSGVSGQSIALSPEAGKGGPNALALSCPVVGDCVPAQSGTVSIQRRAEDGALTGTYQATWPGGQPRMGRFTAVWRESQKKCG